MKIVTKIFLRKELRQARRKNDVEAVARLEQTLNDPDLLDLVHEANAIEWEYERELRLFQAKQSGTTVKADFGSAISDFFAFLFENREGIFEMIMTFIQLIALFSPAPETD